MNIEEATEATPDLGLAHALVDLGEIADEVSRQAAVDFAQMLPRVVSRVLGDDAAAQRALVNGGFVLNESTVVLRLNPDTNNVEFFCDVGLPESHSLAATYRSALEINLCRTYPGITLGIHPESGRLVATIALNSMLVADDDYCIAALETLTAQVARLRESGLVALQD